jgi:hypothetical protein
MPKSRPHVLLAGAVLLAGITIAGTVITPSPATAASTAPAGQSDPNATHSLTGPPVPAAAAAYLAYKECVPGGATATDATLASQLAPQMNGVRLGHALNAYNVSCARAIISKVHRDGLNDRAAVIAVTTAITESTLHNYTQAADYDSLGLYQQRPSMGWGTPEQITDPDYATHKFLVEMQKLYPNGSWMSGDIGEICQAVQRSAYPAAYSAEVHDAQLLVNALASYGRGSSVSGDGRAELMVRKPDGQVWSWYNDKGWAGDTYQNNTRVAWTSPDETPLFADLDGDGRAELMVRKPDGQVWSWHNDKGWTGDTYQNNTRVAWTSPDETPIFG